LAPVFDRFRRASREPVQPVYPQGKRMYCIGDIHGRADLLSELHEQIRRDSEGFEGTLQVLYLGDYIDRGEQSREVMDILIRQDLEGFEPIHLLGNHEQAMTDFLLDPVAMVGWLSWGGAATLRSYGIQFGLLKSRQELITVRDRLADELPQAHLEFLESCLRFWSGGSYYFVHAGIRPGVALEKQAFEDQLWIRDEFTSSSANHGAIIVHGHTISEQVELLPNRIGVDTGAYQSGVLSALVLEGSQQRFLQTGQAL
jgi:serine/threonine protein phosphatase 1